MKMQTLLRHVANNVENDRAAGFGLMYGNRESDRQTADLIDWQKPDNYTLGDELPQEQFVPVVGEECELTPHNSMWGFSDGKPVICTVVGLHLDWIVVAEEHCAPITTRLDKCDLAPVKSEREKVIDEAVGVMNLALDDSQDGWANALYDAGMLVMPESDKC